MILLLDTTPCPALTGLVDAATGAEKVPGGAALASVADGDDDDNDGSDDDDSKAEERRLLLAQTLVGELVLATKEVRRGSEGGSSSRSGQRMGQLCMWDHTHMNVCMRPFRVSQFFCVWI